MIGLRSFGLIFIFTFLAQSQRTSYSSAKTTASSPVAVDLPIQEWLEDYQRWMHRDPKPMQHDAPSSTPEPLMLGMPFLEFFSPDRAPLYRGSNSEQNAAFLRDLQHKIPSHGVIGTSELGPSLQEYMGMVAELKPYEKQVMAEKRFTIFAVTYPDREFCKAQNDALRQLGSRPDIQVIEIKLHS